MEKHGIAELFRAVREGDESAAAGHLDAHPHHIDVRETLEEDKYLQPLHAAAAEGHLPVVRLLVERGATVYSHPFCSYPAVLHADWAGHQNVVDYFLNEIPHLAAGTGGIGVTCNLAARQGWKDQVSRHLARDPLAVHQRGWIGDTPLHWPSHNGFVDIVKMLLDAGADPNVEEDNWIGGSPLHWASERHADIIRLLVKAGGNPDARVTRPGSHHLGATPLIWCAKQEDDCAAAALALLECGADPSLRDADGKLALDHARPHIAEVLRSLP